MRILVIGATGGSGRAVTDVLLERGHQVTALSRSATRLEPQTGLDRVDGDATDVALLDRIVPGHDGIVVTLGISEPPMRVRFRGARDTANDVRSRGTAAIVSAARHAGIRRLIVQSSYGVGDSRTKLTFATRVVFALMLRPQIIDSEIQEGVLRGSELDWTIVQPVYLIDGDSTDRFTSVDGSTRQAKVSRRAVAQVHADLVEGSDAIRETVAVSG